MVLLPTIKFEKPFEWANSGTRKMNFLGSLVAFWITFTLLGGNLLVAEKLGKEFVPGVLLFFCLFGAHFAGFSGLLARTMSRKTVLFIGLTLMFLGTIAIYHANSFGLFALTYIVIAAGYVPVISVTGHLNHDLLGDDANSLSRGRICWGALNYVASGCTAFAILLIHREMDQVWFALSIAALIGAASVVVCIKEEVAVKERPFTVPDEDRFPFGQQLLTKDKSVHFSWEYVLVIAGSLSMRMWPVFFMEEWIAVAMIFCGEIANGLCGPLQVKLIQWLAKKNRATQKRIVLEVANGTLVAFAIALLFIWTGVAALCIIGAIIIGVTKRVFTYLKITLSDQNGRGSYTFFVRTLIGHGLCCVVAMVSMTMTGIVSSLLLFTLIGIVYYNRTRLSNLIASIMTRRQAKS